MNCGRESAKKYTVRSEGKELVLELCTACHAALYPETENDFFGDFVRRTDGDTRECPFCGTTFDDFRRTGLLGCAECYAVFRENLLPTVRFVQGGERHTGKAPSGLADEKYDRVRALVEEKETLKGRLKEAERKGNDEAAEILRAEIESVNKKLYGGED